MAHHHHSQTHRHHHHTEGLSVEVRTKKLRLALLLTATYLVAELIGALVSGSLALLADAGHMFADVAAIALALFAAWMSTKVADVQKTFGYHRLEILAALINGLALVLIAVLIMQEAWQRFIAPEPVAGGVMMAVAIGGLLVNIVVASVLHQGHQHNLNMKGAYLHVLGDLLGSVGAIVAAGLINLFGWLWADAAISIIIAILILISAVRLVVEAADILLENAPPHIDVAELKTSLLAVEGVLDIHDLHVWTIASGKYALSAHIGVSEPAYGPETLSKMQTLLKERFGLSHTTLQLEPPDFEEGDIHF